MSGTDADPNRSSHLGRLDREPDFRTLLESAPGLFVALTHQVLLNLVSNGSKFNRAGGRLTIGCQLAEPGYLRIAVRDTGIGIPRALQSRLFTPFDRLGAASDGVEGTGLGLTLAKRLQSATEAGAVGATDPTGTVLYIEDNPSHLRLVERVLAEESRIRFIGTMQGRARAGAGPRARAIRDRSILIVDDEPSVAAVLAEALTNEGHVVETAENGAVGLEKLAAVSYDLVICDSGMLVLNGPDLYREVERRDPRLAEKFIFVVGDILNPRTQEFLGRVNTPQLIKPFTIDTVKQLVCRMLSAR